MGSSPEPDSDAALLDSFAHTQSNEVFTTLVHRHIDLVYSTALRKVGDRHLAEDITQAVFFVLAKKAARIPVSTILAGWLYQTTRFVSADAIKMKMRRQHHEQAAATLREEATNDSTWPKISPLLDTAMDGLAARDRDIILLRFFEGMEVADIARAANIPANTISKRLQRALERLRKFFADQGIITPAATIGTAIVAGTICHAPESLAAMCASQVAGAPPGIVLLASRMMGSGLAWAKAVAVLILSLGLIGAVVAYVANSAAPVPASPSNAPPIQSVAKAPTLTGPLQPTSPIQLQQIRAAMYELRYYHIFVRNDEWIGAMRTLVQIGRPAVPELVAELDRTNRDSTLRGLAFTLRAIGDPRACPALIRAINRTPPMSSDCGLNISDPAVVQFMLANEMDHEPNNMIIYGRAVREICGALTRMTKHKIGRPWNIDANSDSPADTAKSKREHEDLTKQWQAWWNLHQKEIVSDADLATLTSEPHDAAGIEAAGMAIHGQLFPTGAAFHLGPVHEEYLHVWDEQFDTTEVLDFDQQRKMTLIELLSQTPPTTRPIPENEIGIAISKAGATAIYSFRKYLPAPPTKSKRPNPLITFGAPDPSTRYYWLDGQNQTIWPADNERWDSLEKEIKSGQPIVSGAGITDYRLSLDGKVSANTFPSTFFFRTSKAGAGIVQLLGSDLERQALHLRYRMVEPPLEIVQPTIPAPIPKTPPFGEIREVVLASQAPGTKCVLDLDTGEVLEMPKGSPADTSEWLQSRCSAFTMLGMNHKPTNVMFENTAAIRLSDAMFDTMDSGLAALLLDRIPAPDGRNRGIVDLTAKDPSRHYTIVMPSTGIYRTKNGTTGIMQVVLNPSDPTTLKLRYKLIPQPTTQPSP